MAASCRLRRPRFENLTFTHILTLRLLWQHRRKLRFLEGLSDRRGGGARAALAPHDLPGITGGAMSDAIRMRASSVASTEVRSHGIVDLER